MPAKCHDCNEFRPARALTGDNGEMKKGIPRNFHIYEPLEFLAEVTQHIPNKGEYQIRYYGWYSNKKRGMRQAGKSPASSDTSTRIMDEYWQKLESDTPQRRKFRLCWAALIKLVYEVDPLKCPKPVLSLPKHVAAK
jgi:hypothetical protein